MNKPVLFDGLYAQIREILQAARQHSYRAVNVAMVEAYWQIGRQIVEHEQTGEHRAAYGQRVLAELAKQLSEEFGKGFTAGNLRNFRQFYQTFNQEEICDALRSNLTWTDNCQFYLGFPILITTWRELRWSHVISGKDSVTWGRKNKSPTLKKGG